MKTHWESQLTAHDSALEGPGGALPWGERLIRWFLLTGFVIVLLIEAWFLWQILLMA